jgi:hypothetical protein
MEISKENVAEEVKQPTKAELAKQKAEYAERIKEFNKRRNDEKAFLKKESDFMELEYKYMELMMALPAMRAKFQEFMSKAQAQFQKPDEKAEDLTPVPDNVVKMDTGTPIVTTE